MAIAVKYLQNKYPNQIVNEDFNSQDFPSTIYFDLQRTQQILYHLLSNALKFNRPLNGRVLLEVQYESHRGKKWDKLVFNVVGNVLTTLTQSTNGDASADPQLRHIHSLMVDEVVSLCAGLSPPVQLSVTAEKYLAAMAGSDHKASTLQDLLAGRPFEKDALVTAVQEVARSAGVATPYIDFAGALLQGLERNAVLAKM